MNLLEIRDLAIEFRLDENTRLAAVKGVSFDVPVRSTVALVGESGSGKSVTALSVMGLLPRENATISTTSRIRYRERDLLTIGSDEMQRVRGKEIGMIFQEPMTSLNPVFTVGFQIREVLRKHLGLAGRALRERTVELLAEVGIPEPQSRLETYPFQLSGGQQQRVMIAMAIACEPKLLIADEPTTALDVTVQRQIMDLMAALQERHEMAMLFITHDLALVSEIADYVVVMRDGEVREQAPASQLFRDPRDAYTRALLACRPPLDRRPQRLPVINDFMGSGLELRRRDASIQDLTPERKRGLRGDEPTLLEARGLAKSFYFRDGLLKKRELKAVKGASFRIAKGKTLGVVGESGSGKTTVALLVARLHQASGGEVRFEGRDLLKVDARHAMPYKRRIQIVFQNPYASLNPRFTVAQILTEPLQIHGIGADDGERRAMAAELLTKVGLPALSLEKYPHEFSGGQRQRIAIARALTLKPELLICDESVSALDVSVQAQLLNLLQDLQDEYSMSYLFISHDLAVVRYMADEVMVMKDGEVVEIAGPDELYANPKHPYTRLLLSSIPGRAH
ncbi:MAG TPA: dipeptide ABC transporter ATP-binding protein [Burkholderiales bacterium]|nr:dipeptide ABC transporter ATP-binding protein [Burkholderiales bacterium]